MLHRQLRLKVWNIVTISFLVLMAAPFGLHAIDRGGAFHTIEEQASRLFSQTAPISTTAIYAHMIAGGVITLLAPLQLLSIVRQHWPRLHRTLGYLVVVASGVAGLGGLFYVGARGTIGGPIMDLGFGLYGVLMVFAALRTVQLARRRDPLHQIWAERLVILAMASWLYRVHYGIWEIATGGVGSTPTFTGPFDIIQVFAFYVPYLLLHAWFRRRARQKQHV